MSHVRTFIALRALPVSTALRGVNAIAQCGLDCFYFSTPHYKIATPRRHFDGIAAQN